MPTLASKPKTRYFSIEDDGDSFQVYLFDGLVQVGGCCFPDDGTGSAFDLANEVGMAFGRPINAVDRLQ